MAPPVGTLRVSRYFAGLALIIVALYAVVGFGSRHTPKLGLDLVGGIRLQYTAVTPKGSPPPTSSQMSQARQILEDRINGSGVTGSTVVVQGSDQLVVEIPGGTATDVARLGDAAVLNFRGLMTTPVPQTCYTGKHAPATTTPSTGASVSTSVSPSSSGSASTSVSPSTSNGPTAGAPSSSGASGQDAGARPLTGRQAKPSSTPSATPGNKASTTPSASTSASTSTSATPSATASSSAAAAPQKCTTDPFAAVVKQFPKLKPLLEPAHDASSLNAESCPSPSMPSVNNKTATCNAFDKLTSAQQSAITSALTNFDCASAQYEADIPQHYYIACDDGKAFGQKAVYLFGHVVVAGHQIKSASAQAPNLGSGGGSAQWTVNLTLGGSGADAWHAWTSKYNDGGSSTGSSASCGASAGGLPCSDFVGFTLDGQAISVPVTESALSTQTQVTGNFTQGSADDLARELNYGKLPISFKAQANQQVSATLGNHQLKAAFLAGGIGLILVVLYSLIYYRALGLVTIASLIVSAGLTYSLLVILGTQMGFTLDLAGIAGFIVALGITADSFVVFFERLKDEVHEGRSARVAVPRAWVRARRTILSADTVSFLAAAILYYFASADVKGFAFTLGLSTILDLIVVFLFTHPLVSLLSRMKSFGSRAFTGLDAIRGGPAISDEPSGAARAPRRRPSGPGTSAAQPASGTSTATIADESADTSAAPSTGEPSGDVDPAARRRTPPSSGTAAERAAERRRRMREQSSDDEKGES